MAKKIKEATVEEVTNVATKTNQTTDLKTYTILYEGSKKYSLVEVSIDSKSLDSTTMATVNVVEKGLDYYQVLDSFKSHVIKAGLFDKRVD
jgi:hypothetical protein